MELELEEMEWYRRVRGGGKEGTVVRIRRMRGLRGEDGGLDWRGRHGGEGRGEMGGR